MTSQTLVLLMLSLWGCLHDSSGDFCMDQPSRIESFVGMSVTFSCHFAFPVAQDNINSSLFILRAANYNCDKNTDIYTSDTKESYKGYHGRLNVTFDLQNRNASVTINNITKKDNKKFCCRTKITLHNGTIKEWQSSSGTQLIVEDKNKPSLETTPVIFAAPGDNVTIVGHFTNSNVTLGTNITCYGWRTPDLNTGCGNGGNISICTYHNNTLSLQINQVTEKEDQGFYCWSVEIPTNNKEKGMYTYLGPQLLITDKTNNLNITQPEEMEISQSTTISCSFTFKKNNNFLRMEVYWMTGDSRESYVYHPNMDYIHPDYKGKTKLVNGSNLYIEDFDGPDNTTVYCRVIIRQCLGPHDINDANRIKTILEEGPGTRLVLKDIKSEPSTSASSLSLTIVLCVVAFSLVIIITLTLYFMKKRGNKQKSVGETMVEIPDDLIEGHENPTKIQKQQKNEDLVYAIVNHSASCENKKMESPPDHDTEVVYAAVKKT